MSRQSTTLQAQQWKAFFFEDVLIVKSGKRLTKAEMSDGLRPFVGASEANNGITAFTNCVNESIDNNVLGVNYNGSVGFSFYHPYSAIFSDDVKRVCWLNDEKNNRYTLLFLASVIRQQKDKYAYGYKFNGQRMKRQKILLPVATDGVTPDWAFMETYMRQKEQEILQPTITKLCKRLIFKHITRGGASYFIKIGKLSILLRCSHTSREGSGLKNRTTRQEISPMFPQQASTMASMDTLETRAA